MDSYSLQLATSWNLHLKWSHIRIAQNRTCVCLGQSFSWLHGMISISSHASVALDHCTHWCFCQDSVHLYTIRTEWNSICYHPQNLHNLLHSSGLHHLLDGWMRHQYFEDQYQTQLRTSLSILLWRRIAHGLNLAEPKHECQICVWISKEDVQYTFVWWKYCAWFC